MMVDWFLISMLKHKSLLNYDAAAGVREEGEDGELPVNRRETLTRLVAEMQSRENT